MSQGASIGLPKHDGGTAPHGGGQFGQLSHSLESMGDSPSCAGSLGHPFRKRNLERDLLAPFCLQERGGKVRIREHSCISNFGTFHSLRKGEACVPCSHPYQTTNSSLLSRTLRWHCSLDETALHLPSVWNNSRPCQREVRTACRKRVVAATTHHPTSASQTTGLQEDRYIPLGASCEDDSDLEAGTLHCAAGDLASASIGNFTACSGSTRQRLMRDSRRS